MTTKANREVTTQRIHDLKQSGYFVVEFDVDPPVYQWAHASGVSQRDVASSQPPRSTEAQAWRDCDAYARCEVPTIAEPDWRG